MVETAQNKITTSYRNNKLEMYKIVDINNAHCQIIPANVNGFSNKEWFHSLKIDTY